MSSEALEAPRCQAVYAEFEESGTNLCAGGHALRGGVSFKLATSSGDLRCHGAAVQRRNACTEERELQHPTKTTTSNTRVCAENE